MAERLLILDTNVVLDLLYFDDAAARPIRQALEEGTARCVVSQATLCEWRSVLAYPEFALNQARQEELFSRYQAMSVVVEQTEGAGALPRCSDPDDQKFLELAAVSRVQALVTKDRALLKLRRRCAPLFRIMTPNEALSWLGLPA